MDSCIKCVVGDLTCNVCNGQMVKYGLKKDRQRYQCKDCKRTIMQDYLYKAYGAFINAHIVKLVKEGCGIRSIARLLDISATTVITRIKTIAADIQKPVLRSGGKYQVDELKTYVRYKANEYWVICALDAETRQVVDYKTGKRNKKNIKRVIDTLLLSGCERINTDRLELYRHVIPHKFHCIRRYGTNRIERLNLSLRTHLKRLNRKTICYSKSLLMLDACLRIYFARLCWRYHQHTGLAYRHILPVVQLLVTTPTTASRYRKCCRLLQASFACGHKNE